MDVLVDTSIWIDYFKGGKASDDMDYLLEENLLVTNEVILAELIPFLELRHQKEVIKLLRQIRRLPMDIDWREIIDFQVKCLKNGANGIGIPDLIITQNAQQNDCSIYSMDKHFRLMEKVIGVNLYSV